jgi:hypothetical protein
VANDSMRTVFACLHGANINHDCNLEIAVVNIFNTYLVQLMQKCFVHDIIVTLNEFCHLNLALNI